MTLAVEDVAKIRRLHFAERWRVGTIVAQLGFHRDAVRHALGLDSPRRCIPRPLSPLEPFKDFLLTTLQQYPTLRATRLYQMIRERGYVGSVKCLRRFVRGVRPRRGRAVYVRVETLAGQQAQVDWAMLGKCDVPGVAEICRCSSWSLPIRGCSSFSSSGTSPTSRCAAP